MSPLRAVLSAVAAGPQTLPGLARLVGSPEAVVEGMLSTLVAGGYLEEAGVHAARKDCPDCALKSLCVTPGGACTDPPRGDCADPPRLRPTARGQGYLKG